MKKLIFFIVCLLFLGACNSDLGEDSSTGSADSSNENESGDGYPKENIQVTIPYSAGGGTDTFARAAAGPIEEEFGQSLVINNKPGASGETGATAIANSEPDGYNLGFVALLDFALLPNIKDTTYNYDDFDFLASFTESSSVMLAGEDTGFDSLEGLVEYAKKHPGEVSVSVSGDGHKYILMQLEQEAGVEFTTTSYSGGGESLNAVAGGHVDASIISQSFVQQAEDQGLKTLAISNEERVDNLDHVPTFVESGYNVTAVDARIMVAPKETPDDKVDTLIQKLDNVGESGALEEPIRDLGDTYHYKSGEEVEEFVESAVSRIEEVVEGNEDTFDTE
ncbi:tripartite tricarboxylate transporter substrate binding protein [Salibacterium aidingense]|uniref:tripartite tricarboxylate transporter substrate binding protein n=1 Tax=Salibacterium aidingense TaxID=384933 RepID=UPI003BD1D6ED